MSGFGVTPPWYGDDEIAFNACAIANEKRRDALRRLGVAIRLQPNKRDGNVQNALCGEILGCTLDDLSAAEFEFLTKVVNYEL